MHFVFAFIALGTPTADDKIDARKFGWRTDYAAAKAEAKRIGKPMLVVFRCEP
jgi:hypothetical protein